MSWGSALPAARSQLQVPKFCTCLTVPGQAMRPRPRASHLVRVLHVRIHLPAVHAVFEKHGEGVRDRAG
jgi:hypothetical protein